MSQMIIAICHEIVICPLSACITRALSLSIIGIARLKLVSTVARTLSRKALASDAEIYTRLISVLFKVRDASFL